MFKVIHTATGSEWAEFQEQDIAVSMADNCARALNSTFHVTGIVYVAHTIPAEVVTGE